MTTSPELSGPLRNIPLGFHGETEGHGNDANSRARIQADRELPSSPDWRLGQWIGLPERKPSWLIEKESTKKNDGDT